MITILSSKYKVNTTAWMVAEFYKEWFLGLYYNMRKGKRNITFTAKHCPNSNHISNMFNSNSVLYLLQNYSYILTRALFKE
jgi:hypothetical protein